MLSEEEFIELCSKYKTHELTEAEYRKLRMWVDGSEENYRFFSNYVKLYKAEMRAETYQKAGKPSSVKEKLIVCGNVFTGWLLPLVCLLLLY